MPINTAALAAAGVATSKNPMLQIKGDVKLGAQSYWLERVDPQHRAGFQLSAKYVRRYGREHTDRDQQGSHSVTEGRLTSRQQEP